MKAAGKPYSLPLDRIVIDPRLQMRDAGLDDDHADDLAEAIKNRKTLPPGRVRCVDGKHFLTDGFHTHEAHTRAGKKEMRVLVCPGTWGEAVLDAAAANQGHKALKRTNADKRRAVEMMLSAMPGWTDGRIAKHLGVSDEFVRTVRKEHSDGGELPTVGNSPRPEDKRLGADGKEYGPKHQAPKPLPLPTETVGIQASSWRGLPLIEVLTTADDQIWAAINSARIASAGLLHDRLTAGDTLGLEPCEVEALLAEVSRLKDHDSPSAEQSATPPPAGPPHPFAEHMARVTGLAGLITAAMKDDGEHAKRLHDYLSWNGLVDHEAGVIDPTRADDDGREESKLSFLPLRGIRALLKLAGEPGRKRTEREVRQIYDKASGGWVPPATGRRRKRQRVSG